MHEVLIGWIVPDDGIPGCDYETLRLNPWLRARGLGGVRIAVERSYAEKRHHRDDLLVTGDLAHMLPAARRLSEAGCTALMWACTSASFIGGLDWARRQAEALSEATALPANSTTLALLDAAAALGASKVDVLGAYPEPVTAALVDCFRDAGFAVGNVASLGMPIGPESFRLDLAAEVRHFVEHHSGEQVPLVIPDTAINSLDLVERLEAIAGCPVVTANQASLWQSLAMAGRPADLPGLGTLFRASDQQLGEVS